MKSLRQELAELREADRVIRGGREALSLLPLEQRTQLQQLLNDEDRVPVDGPVVRAARWWTALRGVRETLMPGTPEWLIRERAREKFGL